MLSVRIRPGLPEKLKKEGCPISEEKPVKVTKPQQPNPAFFADAGLELKRISWPTKQLVTKATILVLAIVTVSSLYVGALDALLTKIFFLLKGIK